MSTRRVLVGLLAAASVALTGQGLATADAPPAVHRGQLVPEMPQKSDVAAKIVGLRKDGKLVGKIHDMERIGQRIVVGGNFSTIQLPDGTTTEQPNLAAFDVDTGEFDAGFRPVVDGEVLTILKGDTQDTAFIGGRFKNVGPVGKTQYRKSLAKISTIDGAPFADWSANAWGVVSALDSHADNLYVGGDFSQIGGVEQKRLARLSVSTGAVDPKWDIEVEEPRNNGFRFSSKGELIATQYFGPTIRELVVGPEGGVLWVAHRAEVVGGEKRVGIAKIYTGYGDRTDGVPEVTGWKTSLWDTFPTGEKQIVMLQDMAMDPARTRIVVVANGNNWPPYNDVAVSFRTRGSGERQPEWVTQNFDSTYAVAISDTAVYIGGHFCWTESEKDKTPPESWPGKSHGKYSCYGKKSGEVFAPATSFHYHLAALNPETGRAFDAWKGSSTDSSNGVTALTVIDRGLLVGHDGTSFGRKTDKKTADAIETGAVGFFDLGSDFDA